MAPDYALGHIAAGVGRGRLTFFVDNRTKVELAAAARRDALAALEADPESDLAYHLLGRWHYEMAQVPCHTPVSTNTTCPFYNSWQHAQSIITFLFHVSQSKGWMRFLVT